MDPKNAKFRFSNVSLGQKGDINPNSQSIGKNLMSPQQTDVFDDNLGVVDF